ncbi:MAG: hypothetical protein ACLQL2_06420 [Methylovirgula sp.]
MTEQASPAHRDLIAWAKQETKRLIAIVLYLWVTFGLYVLSETIVLGARHINFASHGFAIINAVVLAKVLLIAEDFNFADGFKDKPLVYPILYKAFAFAVLFVAAHVIESELLGLRHGKGAIASFPPIGGGTVKGFLCVVALMFVALIPFFAFREIGRVIGEDKLWDMIFKRGAISFAPSPAQR